MSDSKVNVLCRFVHNLYVKMSQISNTFISDHTAFCGDVQSLHTFVYVTSNAYTMVRYGPLLPGGVFADYVYLGNYSQSK